MMRTWPPERGSPEGGSRPTLWQEPSRLPSRRSGSADAEQVGADQACVVGGFGLEPRQHMVEVETVMVDAKQPHFHERHTGVEQPFPDQFAGVVRHAQGLAEVPPGPGGMPE